MPLGAFFKAMQSSLMSWADLVSDSQITMDRILATKNSILELLGSSHFPEKHQPNTLPMDPAGKHASGKEF